MASFIEKRAFPRITNLSGIFYSFSKLSTFYQIYDKPPIIDISKIGASFYYDLCVPHKILPPDDPSLKLYLYNLRNEEKILELEGKFVREIRSQNLNSPIGFAIQFNKLIDLEDFLDESNTERRSPLILIVDDEEHIRLLCSEELHEEGYNFITSIEGDDALEKIHLFKPDLVVLDIKMIETDGLDCLQTIRNKYYDLPVILFTAYDTFRDDIRSIAADFFVIKSFDLRDLKKKIRRALEATIPIKESSEMTQSALIKELKEMMNLLQEENRKLKESILRKIDDFSELHPLIHGWIHDISNKLIAIKSFTEILIERPDHPDLKKFSDNITQIIKDLDDKKQQLYEYMDYGIIRYENINIVELTKEYLKRKNNLISVNFKNYCNDDLEIIGNKTQLLQVFDNIIDNAVKFSDEGSPIDFVIKN